MDNDQIHLEQKTY